MATRDPNLEPRRDTICFLFMHLLGYMVIRQPWKEVIPDMTSYQLTLMRSSIHRNPLNQIVSILIPGNCTKVST